MVVRANEISKLIKDAILEPIAAFARNVTNEDYITGSFSSPPPAIGGRPGDPRRIGVRFTIATPGF